jgi:ribosomal protein S18 acetylase RimI-like enzyme
MNTIGLVNLVFMSDRPGKPAFVYRRVGAEGIDAVRPLWEKLRAYHAPLLDDKPPFLFEPRKQGIIDKAAPGGLRIELVGASSSQADVAYCISTLSVNRCGEIDSIFVEERYRGCGIGSELLRRALAWLDDAGASSKVVTVANGNEGALALYQRFGFHPHKILLQQRHDPQR